MLNRPSAQLQTAAIPNPHQTVESKSRLAVLAGVFAGIRLFMGPSSRVLMAASRPAERWPDRGWISRRMKNAASIPRRGVENPIDHCAGG